MGKCFILVKMALLCPPLFHRGWCVNSWYSYKDVFLYLRKPRTLLGISIQMVAQVCPKRVLLALEFAFTYTIEQWFLLVLRMAA